MAKSKKSNLHKYLFTVTPFSKLLALSMFVTFPIIAFYIGIWYAQILGCFK